VVALDDRYANKFAPVDSTTIHPKPGHVLLYTPLTSKIKCPSYTFALLIPFSISSNVDATQAPTSTSLLIIIMNQHLA